MTSIYDQLHQQILDRNARETDPFWSIHASNHDLVAEVEELQSKYEELKRIGMMHPSGKGSADGAAPEQDMANRESAALQNEVRLREQLEKLQEELSSTEQMRDEEKTKVAETTKGLEEARMLNAKKDKEISILEEERDTLQRGMDHLTGKVTDAEARMSLAEQQCVGLKDSIRLMQEENATVAKSKDDLEARFLTEKTKLSQSIAELMDTVDALKKEVSTLHTFRQKHDERTRWLDDARIIQIKKAKDENDDGGTASSTASSTAAAASVAPSAAAKTVQAHTKEATSARYDQSGSGLVVTCGPDSLGKVWDASTGALRNMFKIAGSNSLLTCDIANGIVLFAGVDKTCRVWELENERMIHHLVGHTGTVNCVRLFAESKAVITGSSDRTLKVWDISRNTYKQTVSFYYASSPNCIDVGSDWLTAISGHADGYLQCWDTISGRSLGGMAKLHEGGITSVQFHPQIENQILTHGMDFSLKIVDITKWAVLQTFGSPELKVSYPRAPASFSPDGKYVGCGSSFGNIFVWKTVGGSLQSVCKGHKDSVRGFGWGTAATKEGSHEVVSVDKHGVMILW